jgi:hypothetical protein
VTDSVGASVTFKFGFEDTANSRRDNSDPILEAFVFVLFLPPGRGRLQEGFPAPCFSNPASIVFYSVLTTFPNEEMRSNETKSKCDKSND